MKFCASGPIHLYCFSPSSLTKQWTPLWAVFDTQDCRMRIFKGEKEEEMMEEINIGDATFIYDLENSQNGEFKIRWLAKRFIQFYSQSTLQYILWRT